MIPVFIGGCERSGTTLLGSLLGANEEAVVLPESRFKYYIIRGIKRNRADDAISKSITGDKKFAHLKMDAKHVKDIAFTDLGVARATVQFVNRYSAERGLAKPTLRYWVDHNPDNLANAKMLIENFPGAKFIHIVRDGRGVASSVMRLDWGPNTILKAAQWWLQKLSVCLAAELYLPREKILRVKYEDLVLQPDATLNKICEFLGMRFHPSMVAGDGSFVSAYTQKQHALVGKLPQASRANDWCNKLSPFEVSCFEKYAGQMLDLLGYDRRHQDYRSISSYQRIKWFLRENFLLVFNIVKKKRRLRQSG
jgi:hypothetical protein